MNSIEKVAIYGGAFNPPSVGHEAVVTGLLTNNHVSKIIFTPDGVRDDKDYGIDLQKRKEIIKIFCEELASRGLNLDFNFHFLEEHKGPTTTVEVDKYFTELLGYSPYHIFGADVIRSINTWSGNENYKIQQEMQKIFVEREGFQTPNEEEMQALGMRLYSLVDLCIPEVSSTIIRTRLKSKLDVSSLLTPKVYDFVTKNNLYSN